MAFATLDRFETCQVAECSSTPDMVKQEPTTVQSSLTTAIQQSIAAAVTVDQIDGQATTNAERRITNPLKVCQLLKTKSSDWESIGRELAVDGNFRDQLMRNQSLTPESKLEQVLKKWIQSQCSEPTWKTLIKALEELDYKDLAQEVETHLRTLYA